MAGWGWRGGRGKWERGEKKMNYQGPYQLSYSMWNFFLQIVTIHCTFTADIPHSHTEEDWLQSFNIKPKVETATFYDAEHPAVYIFPKWYVVYWCIFKCRIWCCRQIPINLLWLYIVFIHCQTMKLSHSGSKHDSEFKSMMLGKTLLTNLTLLTSCKHANTMWPVNEAKFNLLVYCLISIWCEKLSSIWYFLVVNLPFCPWWKGKLLFHNYLECADWFITHCCQITMPELADSAKTYSKTVFKVLTIYNIIWSRLGKDCGRGE